MKKKLTAIVTLIFIIFSLTGCSRDDKPLQTNFKIGDEEIQLEKIEIYSNSVEVYLPSSFKESANIDSSEQGKSGEEIAFSNKDNSVNIIFKYYDEILPDFDVQTNLDAFKKSFTNRYPKSSVENTGSKTINGKKIYNIEAKGIGKKGDQNSYIFFLEVNKKTIMGTVLCKNNKFNEYKPVVDSITQSIKGVK